jgi:hypothetical protein
LELTDLTYLQRTNFAASPCQRLLVGLLKSTRPNDPNGSPNGSPTGNKDQDISRTTIHLACRL